MQTCPFTAALEPEPLLRSAAAQRWPLPRVGSGTVGDISKSLEKKGLEELLG